MAASVTQDGETGEPSSSGPSGPSSPSIAASRSSSSSPSAASSSSSSSATSTQAAADNNRAQSASGDSDRDGQSKQAQSAAHPKRTRTLYNTFLSPSGSISFFGTSWFESRPVKDGESSSGHGSSSSSPGSSSSDSSASNRRARRPSFEEYRSEEPPQARLIRLRGLFDVLMDSDHQDAFAGGRAKEAWRDTAQRARFGAGGTLATGSLAREIDRERKMKSKERQLDADKPESATRPAAETETVKEPSAPPPPRQSYASELLAQCRKCRSDLEAERTKRRKSAMSEMDQASQSHNVSGEDDSSGSASSLLASLWPYSPEKKKPETAETGSIGNSMSSIWQSIAGRSSELTTWEPEADHDGESGYTGSGVWGLSAVKHGSRDRERNPTEADSSPSKLRQAFSKKAREESQADARDGEASYRRKMMEWEGFLKYAESKERELYQLFCELDKNGDMRLDAIELSSALDRAGHSLPRLSLEDFIASLCSSTRTSDPHSPDRADLWHTAELAVPKYVTWPEFRDYLLLLPRNPSISEIYRFYQVRKAFGLFGAGGVFSEFSQNWGTSDRHGATSVTLDGDVSMAGEEKKRSTDSKTETVSLTSEQKPPGLLKHGATDSTEGVPVNPETGKAVLPNASDLSKPSGQVGVHEVDTGEHADEEETEDTDMIHADVAMKFLLAGGIAGAISRSATAPFDRLKIYLITAARSTDSTATVIGNDKVSTGLGGGSGSSTAVPASVKDASKVASRGFGVLTTAMRNLYIEGGGLKAFWLGNGLNCIKIFPESAIKFLSYETSKRAFAKYVDGVSDSRDISGTSRFISGGIGGITSQLSIYPVETLKTRLMSSQGSNAPMDPRTGQRLKGNELLFATAKNMWSNGGLRTYYRGLTAGLIGVFPYSAIDLSTFEGIKLAYISYTEREDPGTLALLAFGSISGSIGATTVYPLNLIRTRLQAAGTPAHPQTYDGFKDAVMKTYRREGFVGFYRGLIPTLAKVVPAVSISYVCYENSKKRLGVA